MKYLRSYLLVPGAGGQILGARPACRPFRRLTTGHPPAKVTRSESSSNLRFPSMGQTRQVSTDGAKKSQLAVVGQVAPALLPPNGPEMGAYVSIPRHNDDKTSPRCHGSKSYPLDDQVCPRHGNPRVSVTKETPEPVSYGQFLSESTSLKATFNTLDPASLEMAFLPTFHAFRNDVRGLFFSDRPKSAGFPRSSSLDSPPRSSDDSVLQVSDVIELDRSRSLEALLPTDNSFLVEDVSPQVTVRNVKREIVLPRTSEPNSLFSSNFNAFLEVHNFQKKESGGAEGENKISEDIRPFPKCEDTPDPLGPFIIHNDRTSIIIQRDLYITNRILEKLKHMDDNLEITPEPTVKASTMSDHAETCGRDQSSAESCCKSLIYSDSAALAEIAESSIADVASLSGKAGISKGADLETSTVPINAPNVGQSDSNLVESPMYAHSSNLPQVSQHQNGKSGTRITNAEFEMPRDQLTRLEYLALQSRKNLYARMKTSAPCVLIDGVHVQHRKLEEAIPGIENENSLTTVGSCAKTETADLKCPSLVSCDNQNPCNSIPVVTVGQNLTGRENDLAPPGASTASEHSAISAETRPTSLTSTNHDICTSLTSINHDISAEIHSVSPTAIDSPQPSFFSNQFIAESVEPFADFDSQVQGFSESNLSELAGHDLDPFQSNSDLKSDQIHNDLEDWFIPLGKEIESMLLTMEASRKPLDCPENLPQDFQETFHDLGEDISNVIEHGDLQPFEEVNTIESVLLSPQGHQPFEPGQSRDKSTSSGNLPPKAQNPNVDIKTETTIKCTRSGASTDINVTETQRYLDKRLPYPFCTETVLQVCGTSGSLHEATQAVENSKSQLVHLSNANSPNPGMLTPKLQFNHMLSKSHENLKPNSKKTVLKIKVVPNTNAQSTPLKQSSEPKSQPSHVLHLSEQPSKISTDVSKLIRRSKFNHKSGPKKARRGDTVMKLRPKKKLNKESNENIKVLSPKELEKMFPSPPKPKPVEKPRKVTIETKAGKEHPDIIENVKQKSAQSGFMAAQFKSRKVQDDILKKPYLKSPAEVKVVNLPGGEVPGVTTMKSDLVVKDQNNAALSARDQKILKSIISHKVKDSFMAVNKKAGVNPEVKNEKHKPETKISQVVNNFPPPGIRYEKSNKVYHNDPKTVYGKILETAKEKPVKEKTPLKVPRPKSPRPESPTPKPNREYVTVKTEPPSKISEALNKATPVNATATTENKPVKKQDENVLPVSASTIIANVMKGSTDVSHSESRWHNLEKTASDPGPDEKLSLDTPKKADVQRRPRSAKSNAPQRSQMSEAKSEVEKTSQDKNIEKKEHGNIAEQDSFREKNVWNLPSEPLFFPFEAPNYKEVLQEPHSKTLTIDPIPVEPSTPKSAASATYQMDFCKLCTENTPGLDPTAAARYRIPLERMKTFPLLNPGKGKTYTVPSSGAMSINPLHDLMLMRNLRRVPAVTKILGATLSAKSQQALDRWKEGLISTLGEEGFQEFYQNQLKRGTDFHSTVRKFLADKLECKDDLCMQSLSKVLGSVSEVSVVESQVVHPLLGYRGVVDCVAKYKGKPVVIEWKRSDKAKPSLKHTYDAPLQLSAYFGAMNFDSNYKAQQVEGGIVAVAYSDGSPADVFELSVEECERYWAKWLKRLHQFYNSS